MLTFQKLRCVFGLFGLKSFHRFAIPPRWEDGTFCISSVLFGHKNGSCSLKCFYKTRYRTSLKVVKTFKKHQNASGKRNKQTKRVKYYNVAF